MTSSEAQSSALTAPSSPVTGVSVEFHHLVRPLVVAQLPVNDVLLPETAPAKAFSAAMRSSPVQKASQSAPDSCSGDSASINIAPCSDTRSIFPSVASTFRQSRFACRSPLASAVAALCRA
ncbi:hypothetical protein HDG38_005834 [Paraburkholderia sp. WSM4177]|nr:hypothetical protein [Paraburkholderia sp. WSM4177]